jgi:hypothetical protein
MPAQQNMVFQLSHELILLMLRPLVPLIQVQRHDDGLHGVDFARVGLRSFHGAFIAAPVDLEYGIAEAEGPHGTCAVRDERHGGEHRLV